MIVTDGLTASWTIRPAMDTDPIQDFVTVEDYADAIKTLGEVEDDDDWYGLKLAEAQGLIGPLGRTWREHAIGHLYAKVDASLRDASIPRTELQFLAKMRTLAQGYQEAAEALKVAAARLSKAKDLHGARQAHLAGVAMARAAQELIGEDG